MIVILAYDGCNITAEQTSSCVFIQYLDGHVSMDHDCYHDGYSPLKASSNAKARIEGSRWMLLSLSCDLSSTNQKGLFPRFEV